MEENYWRGDWPAFGGVARIIGTYDAINAKMANLDVSSVKRSEYRSLGRGWVLEECVKGEPTRDHLCHWNRPWCEAGVG